jgi:hypothetical protein
MWRLLAPLLSFTLLATTALLANAALLEAHVSGSELLLPNLVADPPDNMALVTSGIEGKTRLLLRFNGYVHNTGPGALDFRGSREKPTVNGKSEREIQEEIAVYKSREESLPQALEEELSAPAMKVSQRLFTTNEGNPAGSEKYLERSHLEEASAGEMFYSDADGHHHWHLQHVAKYSNQMRPVCTRGSRQAGETSMAANSLFNGSTPPKCSPANTGCARTSIRPV